MPPHQISEASEAHLPSMGGASTRPRRVSTTSARRQETKVEALRAREPSISHGTRVVPVRGHASDALRPHADALVPRDRITSRQPVRVSLFRSALKRAFDVTGAVLLGLVFAPLMIGVAVLLRREGGPIIYRHRRIGRDGRVFECLKFRSMVPNADRVLCDLLERRPELKVEWVRDHKLRGDPRVTRLGRFLRRTSLDELPQIWNVLRGEMSLVGPRPVVREELMRYGRSLPVYLSAKPGITGLWQVTGRNDTSYRRRVALDVYYVRRQNLLLDLYIVLKTTRVVVGGGGAY